MAVWLNPFRETVATVFLVPFIAALFAGFRPKLITAVVAGIVFLVAATALVQGYRKVLWYGRGIEELQEDARSWTRESLDAPWIEPLRRFHSLDSFLLTVSVYPDVLPYTGDNLFAESIGRGLLPRAVNPDKGQDDEGRRFGQTVWSNGSYQGGASIAPSAPGSLYSAGGPTFVALGAALWGALVSICESWKRSLSASAQAGITVMLGLSFAASVERGFSHNVSTVLQQLVVLSVVLALVAVKRGRRSQLAAVPHAVVLQERRGAS
jgi:hypothetical protein